MNEYMEILFWCNGALIGLMVCLIWHIARLIRKLAETMDWDGE